MRIIPTGYYENALSFSEGFAPVSKYGKWGFIDKVSNEVLPFNYEQARCFKEGVAHVLKDGKWGLINKEGSEITPFIYDAAFGFENGLVAMGYCGMRGFLDKEGEEAIPFVFDMARSFTEGLSAVKKDGKWGYIDMTGNEIIPFIYEVAWEFAETLAPVKLSGKAGFIDKTGNEVIPFVYDDAWNFKDGLAPVEKDGKFGFIDKAGNEIIPFIYDSARYFEEGLAEVKKGYLWGFIDKSGKEIIPFVYDEVNAFNGGVTFAEKNGKCGVIDKTGKEITPFIFDYDDVRLSFAEGLAAVKLKGLWGFIDTSGKMITPHPSLHDIINANIDENGRMPPDFNLEVKVFNDREVGIAPGMFDGSMFYHSHRTFCKLIGEPLAPEKEAEEIAVLLINYFDSGDMQFIKKAENVLTEAKHGAWAIAEDILQIIWQEGSKRGKANDNDYTFSMLDSSLRSCLNIIKTTNNADLLKISLTLLGYLGVADLEESITLLLTLAAYEDFTHYALIAISCLNKFVDSNALVFDIASRVDGWGLVHAIEHLEPRNDEIRDWILCNGCEEGTPKLYLALTCAYKGDLISALRQETLDTKVFEGVSEVIDALLNEEPMPGISAYEHAEEALLLYLRHAESRPDSEITNRIKEEIQKLMEPSGEENDES
jgi:hypothetical protein